MIADTVLARVDDFAADFRNAKPFRHIVIENFFTADASEKLLAQFPAFERGNARNEAGELGAKSTVERIRNLGDEYAALDDVIKTPDFLRLIGRITSIPD